MHIKRMIILIITTAVVGVGLFNRLQKYTYVFAFVEHCKGNFKGT